jgi:hypothetical protein
MCEMLSQKNMEARFSDGYFSLGFIAEDVVWEQI